MAFTPRTLFTWQLRARALALGAETKIMGILNATPDSFSDGGSFLHLEQAVARAHQMLDEGAHILDIGGESTRPSATPVSPAEEQARVLPILEALHRSRPHAILSIDTYHASTARLALRAGADIVNDVSGHTWDPAMSSTCAELGCGVILMHTRGTPQQWREQPPIPPLAVMPIILTGLRDSLLTARTSGIPAEKIVLDPGFSFGKRGVENYVLHALLHQLQQFGLPVLTGTSRKGFLVDTLTASPTLAPLYNGIRPAAKSSARLHATIASGVAAILSGSHILRVHDVRPAAEAAAIADDILLAAASLAAQSGPAFTPAASHPPQ